MNEIKKALSGAVGIGFTPNKGKQVGVISICFDDCNLPFHAYKKMIELFNRKNVTMDIVEFENTFKLIFNCETVIEPIQLEDVP